MEVTLTDDNFQKEVMEEKSMPVVVDFWAPWCGPCKIISPVIEKLAEEFKGKIKVGKMNVDENTQFPGQFGIMSIPTIMFFKNGKVIKSMIGAQGEEAFRSQFNAALTA